MKNESFIYTLYLFKQDVLTKKNLGRNINSFPINYQNLILNSLRWNFSSSSLELTITSYQFKFIKFGLKTEWDLEQD